MEGIERRNPDSKRIEVTRPVAIFAEGREGILRGKTRNISTDGCSINLDDMLDIGETVLFRIDLGEGFDPAIQSAKVIWTDGDKGAVGVLFSGDRAGDCPEAPEKEKEVLPENGCIVSLNIETMDKPLRVICQKAGSSSITLRTSIPFLETRKKVAIRFKDESGEEREVSGMLTDVALEKAAGQPVPYINLLVSRGDKDESTLNHEPPLQKKTMKEVKRVDRDAEPVPEIAQEASEEVIEETGEAQPQVTETLSQYRDVDAFERSFEEDREDAKVEEKITPGYVIVIQTLLSTIITCLKTLKEKLGPPAGKIAPVMKKYSAILFRGMKAAASTLYHEGLRLLKREKKQRKTRLTMRRQVPKRSKALLGSLKSVKWQILLLVVTILAFSAGVWGLVNLFNTNNEDLPEPSSAALPHITAPTGSQGADTPSDGNYDLWGEGSKISKVNIESAAVVNARAPEKAEPKKTGQAQKLEAAALPEGKQAEEEATKEAAREEKIKDLPLCINNSVRLYVKGEIYGFKHYPLAQPPGVVVDVKGAQPRLVEGKKDVKGSKVKYIKTIQRDDGTRFIIIFHGNSIPQFELIAHSDRIELKLI